MELNVITGRAGSGKSRFCIENISRICTEDPENRVFLIVPEQFAIQAERRMLEAIPTGGVLNNEVLSFKRLTHRVLNRYGGVNKKVLDLSGRSMVLAHAFRLCQKHLKYYQTFCRNIWNVDKVMNLITELVRYGVTPEQLSEISEGIQDEVQTEELSVKMKELSLVYTQYKTLLNTDYMDELDMHQVLIAKLEKEKPFAGAVIWIDAFTGFTTLELEIIECLVKQCTSVNICLLGGDPNDQTFRGVRFTLELLDQIAVRTGCRKQRRHIAPDTLPRFTENSALAALEREFGRYPAKPYEKVPGNIRINKCTDLHSEVYNSALEIQRLCSQEGLRFRDISVTVRDMERYKNIISAIYPLMGISYFMDDRMPLDRHPLTAFILDTLGIIAEGFRYDSVFSFLKSGYYRWDRAVIDRLENYILARGIRSKSGWEKPMPDPECEALRQDFMGKINILYEAFRTSRTYKEGLLALCDFLDGLKLEEALGEDRELGLRIWDMITRIFGQLYDFLGDEPCRGIAGIADELRQLLRSGFSKHSVGSIPEDTDCVQIGAADRSRTNEIEALIVMGANEGVFPASFKDDGLLSDQERELLQKQGITLSETMKTRAYLEQFLIYRTLTSPKKYLYISYALDLGDDSKGRPSWLIRRVKKILPEVVCTQGEAVSGFSPEETSCLEPLHEAWLSQDIAIKLFLQKDGTVASVSGMEAYMKCPYSFFADKGLAAKPRAQYTVENFDTGSFLHLLLEYGTRELMKSNQEVTREDCTGIIQSVTPEALCALENQAMTGTARNRFLTDRLVKFAGDSLYAVACQCRDSAYIPGGFEVKFGYPTKDSLPPLEIRNPDGSVIKVKGKIDRYDYWDHEGVWYFRIIDYKSSQQKLNPGEAYDGYKMQLMTYMDALETAIGQDGGNPVCGGVFYFAIPTGRVKDADFSLKGLFYDEPGNIEAMAGENGKGGLKRYGQRVTGCSGVPEGGFDFLKNRVRANISEITEHVKQGRIPVAPVQGKNWNACTYCNFKGVCGFAGKAREYSATDDAAVWDLKNKED